jgi:hypothetical protein
MYIVSSYGVSRPSEVTADLQSQVRHLSGLMSQIIEHLEIFVACDFTLRITLGGDQHRDSRSGSSDTADCFDWMSISVVVAKQRRKSRSNSRSGAVRLM